MSRSKILWFALGGVALVALGFAAGYFLNGAGGRMVGFHPWVGGTARVGAAFPLMLGLGALGRVIACVGPLAGIAALIIVLTQRSSSGAPSPASTASPSTASDATTTAASDSTPPMPIKKK